MDVKPHLMKSKSLIILFIIVIFTLIPQHARSQISEIENIVKSHGFEFRPKEETPWGVARANEKRLIWIEENNIRYRIDPEAGIRPPEAPDLIRAYVKKHAKNEVELIAELLLGEKEKYTGLLDDLSPGEYKISIKPPPMHTFRVRLPDFRTNQKVYEASCDFLFVEYHGRYFLVYAYRREYQSYDSITEPHCDLS